MRVLGIETSCDETGIAIYDDKKGLLANQLYSQVKLHADYGGVVPELASRDHVRKTVPLIQAALKEAGLTASDIDAVAYTAGPGLRYRPPRRYRSPSNRLLLMPPESAARFYAHDRGKPVQALRRRSQHVISPDYTIGWLTDLFCRRK